MEDVDNGLWQETNIKMKILIVFIPDDLQQNGIKDAITK